MAEKKPVANANEPKEIQKGWFVLRAISGKEAKVKEILDSAIKNQSPRPARMAGIDSYRKSYRDP